MKRLFTILIILFSITIFFSCEEEEIAPQTNSNEGGWGEALREGF